MSAVVNVDADIANNYTNVRDDGSETNWLVCTYQDDNNIVCSGEGVEYSEFVAALTGESRAYGYLRVITGDEMSKRAKFALVTYVGAVSPLKRARMSTDKAEVKKILRECAVEVLYENETPRENEIREAIIKARALLGALTALRPPTTYRMVSSLVYSPTLTTSDPEAHPVIIVGQLSKLNLITYDDVKVKLEPRVSPETFQEAVATLRPSPTDTVCMWLKSASIAALPSRCSRHNTPTRSHALSRVVKSFLGNGEEYVVIVCERGDVLALGCAVARVLPLYSKKSSKSPPANNTITVEFVLVGEDRDVPLAESDIACLTAMSNSIRLSASIVDKPCADMDTDALVKEACDVAADLNITPLVIRGEELREKGFGGIYGVGKAAAKPPALVVLSHRPDGATKNIAWVGKGIVFDTGGLCIKAKVGMCGMKRDCGGAAGILGAFYAAVKLGFSENLHCILCIAENAVGPDALRPDDIITLYSGKTVEINNTDAEGRLVLGDGVAYAYNDLKAEIVLDMATLTGAQSAATGKLHAGLVTNNESWEADCVTAGKLSGDLVHPLPYCPELHFAEFSSGLADMKNSVADRSNAQTSCAGLFIASHLGLYDFPGVWVHVDMAGPAYTGDRATGYGVALLNTLFHGSSHNSLIKYTMTTPRVDSKLNMSAKKPRTSDD